MEAAAKVAAITAAMSGDEDSPFEPSYFHLPEGNGSVILTIDAQKPWETIESYGNRVTALLAQNGLTEKKDPKLMCRVFLGGLRRPIQDAVLVLHVESNKLVFRRVFYFAQFLENSSDVTMRVMDLNGALPPKWKENVKPGRKSMVQDGLEFFGETNKSIDNFYESDPIVSPVKILYRR